MKVHVELEGESIPEDALKELEKHLTVMANTFYMAIARKQKDKKQFFYDFLEYIGKISENMQNTNDPITILLQTYDDHIEIKDLKSYALPNLENVKVEEVKALIMYEDKPDNTTLIISIPKKIPFDRKKYYVDIAKAVVQRIFNLHI